MGITLYMSCKEVCSIGKNLVEESLQETEVFVQ